MFKNWGFLLGEIWILILLAALLGLFAGWLIWGRRTRVETHSTADYERLETDLNACTVNSQAYEAEIGRLNLELEAKEALREASTPIAEPVVETIVEEIVEHVVEDVDPVEVDAELVTDIPDFDGDGIFEGVNEGVKPTTLDGPRDGVADDLKMIKGVGEKMEQLCNTLGFYHFDQIANWTPDEVAWVDANLEGFKGRVSRDGWVEQSELLASGGETEFSKRVKKGDVY